MKMKKLSIVALFAAFVFAQFAGQAIASIRTISMGDTITVRYSGINYRQGNGGEFQLGKVNAPANPNFFHTFCAETGEVLGGSNQQYYVKSVGLVTNAQGGVLTSAGAKLYRDYYDAMVSRSYGYQGVTGGTYANGSSSSFSLGGGFLFNMATAATRAASGESVQKVLWKSLGYTVSLNAAETAMFNHYVGTYNTFAFTGQYFGVRVATLVNPNDHAQRFQDQFVIIPEPGSMLVWAVLGLSASGLALGRRRQG